MTSLVNMTILALATLLFTIFYIRSVQPAKLEGKIGEISYKKCTTYRAIASVLEVVIFFSYILFYFLPSPIGVTLPWNRSISILIACLIGIPALWIMFKGIIDAGKEGMSPNKAHEMFGGIYESVRHPQTSGGVLLWFAIALGSHSLFLVLYSFIWIAVYWTACSIEEADLLRRFGEDYENYRKRVGMFLPKFKSK
jgi:protein-S-isoprenylcysteine O-methyltransferase Ste14